MEAPGHVPSVPSPKSGTGYLHIREHVREVVDIHQESCRLIQCYF